MLAYYARHFYKVEINSSYYALPGERAFGSMANRTPDSFSFVVKTHKDVTHSEHPTQELFDKFLGSIVPLRETGKLGCVLAQFPWSFKCIQVNSGRLREFRGMIGNLPTVIELRNSEWANEQTFELLQELDLGFCCVDEPGLRGLMPSCCDLRHRICSLTWPQCHELVETR